MKILIFYTPRSKSTMLHDLLCKKFQLIEFRDTVTKSRIKNKNFDEYEKLFSYINNTDNICIKLNGNDFIDPLTGNLSDLYKNINYQLFDKIIFLTRKNYVDAILSYAYMDPNNSDTWHRKKSQSIEIKKYSVPHNKIFHLLNGYVAYDTIKKYITSIVDPSLVKECDYESLDVLIQEINLSNVDIDLCPMNIDYKSIVSNYDEVVSISRDFFQDFKTRFVL